MLTIIVIIVDKQIFYASLSFAITSHLFNFFNTFCMSSEYLLDFILFIQKSLSTELRDIHDDSGQPKILFINKSVNLFFKLRII